MKIPLSYSVRNLWVRRSTSAATLIGIALVVFVYAAVLMLAHGLKKTLVETGSDDNVILIRKAATSELVSGVDRDQANVVKSLPGVALGPDSRPLVATEGVVVINVLKKGSKTATSNLVVRGVSPETKVLRKNVQIAKGRMFSLGSTEIVVGGAVTRRFANMDIGNTVKFGQREWTIVGIFDAAGTGFESEIWGDVEPLGQAFNRPGFSSLTLRLQNIGDFDSFKKSLESDKRLTLDAKREKVFYAEQSKMLGLFISILGTVVTIIFSAGAVIGAMITLYAAVAGRTREIGTLRALGFPRKSVLSAFLIESVATAVVGGVLGLFLASWMGFLKISTTNFTTFSELEFGFALSPAIALQSLVFAALMGVVGGFLPAVRASRLDIVEALRRG